VQAQYGIGGLIAAVWSEVDDCRPLSRSDQVVRHGLDVTVDSSDRRRAGGLLSRQCRQTLRWALFEAAKNSSRARSRSERQARAAASSLDSVPRTDDVGLRVAEVQALVTGR